MDRKMNASPRRHGGFGPGAPMGGREKVAKGTWPKLIRYCKKYWGFIIIALICAATSTVLTLAGPDKLSEMTDTITGGLAPDTDKLQEISETISGNLSDNLAEVMAAIGQNISTGADLQLNGSLISFAEQTETGHGTAARFRKIRPLSGYYRRRHKNFCQGPAGYDADSLQNGSG